MHRSNRLRFLRTVIFLRLCPRHEQAYNVACHYVWNLLSPVIKEILASPDSLEAFLVSLKLDDQFQSTIHAPPLFDPVGFKGTSKISEMVVRESGRFLPNEIMKQSAKASTWTSLISKGTFPPGLSEKIKVQSYDNNPPFQKP